ncbi:MAG: hypothetical protein AB7T49_03925 [Oligoflexales bacterium]
MKPRIAMCLLFLGLLAATCKGEVHNARKKKAGADNTPPGEAADTNPNATSQNSAWDGTEFKGDDAWNISESDK